MSFTATPRSPTEIDVAWDLSAQIDGQTILQLTVTQTEWVGGLPKPNTAVTRNGVGQTGKLKFKTLLPGTTYSYHLQAVWQDWYPTTPPIDRIPASIALDAAAATPTGLTDVTDGYFVFDVTYTPFSATAPHTVNATSVPIFADQIPAALEPYLSQKIGPLFDSIWNTDATSDTDPTPLRAHYSIFVANTVATQAANAGYTVNSVQATLPSTGKVFASAHGATPGANGQPATPGAVVIAYQLSGCAVSFDYGSVITSEYEVVFDATLTITITLPPTPPIPATPPTPPPAQTSLVPSAEIVVSNANVVTENFAADLAAFFDGLLSALTLGYVLTFESKITGKTDGYSQSTDIPAIDTLVGEINTIGPPVIAIGFTQFSAAIKHKSIVFDIIHPTDPAPVLRNLADGGIDGPPPPPRLSLGATQVKPGASGLTVVGGDFPAQSMDQLSVWWINTVGTSLGEAEIYYYPDGTSEVTRQLVFVDASGLYQFTATGLSPRTLYAFTACCNGILVSSAFSQPLVLMTAATATVTLTLNRASSPATPGPTMGTAPLPQTAGPWTPPPVTIPSGTAPGDYVIAAMFEGAVLASAPVTVLAPGATVTPILEVVDPGSTPPTVIPAPANTIGGRGFTVQGRNFQEGVVIVMINGVAPGTFAEADAEGRFLLNLVAPGDEATEGLATITATGLNGAASTTILELGIFMV